MTERPEQADLDEAATVYAAALAALTAAAVAETGALFDRFAPGLVEEVPPVLRRLLVDLLARSWAAHIVRARSLAAVTGYRVTGILPPPLIDPDLPRLTAAAETLLDRAAEMEVGAEHADARTPRDGDLDTALRDLTTARIREARDRLMVEEADRWGAVADAAEEAAIDDAVARADAEAERRERVEAARADLRAAREVAAGERAANREALAEEARRRRVAREAAVRDRMEARAERRQAQVARAENIARAEATAAAAESLADAFTDVPGIVGWMRKLDADPCERCLAWWNSGGTARGPTPVRPYSVRMKRHNGCQCVQRPCTQEEADARGFTTDAEPVHRSQRSRDAARQRHAKP